ncbi:MAG: hypothetical protein K6A80_03340 [Saccharofermentans sp.]|nr:hypothetical protein [Saccharofermentans sp.]
MEKKKTPARIFWITKDAGMNRLLWYLILVVLLSAFCYAATGYTLKIFFFYIVLIHSVTS